MRFTRFPGLGVAGQRLAVVFLAAGCSSLTAAPLVSSDGGRDAIKPDGTGPAERGYASDGVDGIQADSGSVFALDARLAEAALVTGDDAAELSPGLDAAGPAVGVDAPGDFGGAAGTGGAGGTGGATGDDGGAAVQTEDALPAAFSDTSIPADQASASPPDSSVVLDAAAGDEQSEPVTDGPGQSTGSDSSVPVADAPGADAPVQPDTAVTPLTVNAGLNQTICAGRSAPVGSPARGGTPPYSYGWSSNPTCTNCISSATTAQPSVMPPATTTFTVTARDSQSAVATDSVTVTVVEGIADAGPEVSVDPGGSVRIGSPDRNGYTYVWTCDRPTCALTSTTAARPTVNPKLSTTYTVAVISPEGCVASDSTTVWVNLPVSTTPDNGETAYPDSASLLAQFAAGVLVSSISADTVTLRESASGTPVAFTYAYNSSLHILTVTPTGANYNAFVGQYTLTLVGGAGGIVSDDPVRPQRLSDDIAIRFTLTNSPDLAAPTIIFRSPDSGSNGVAPNTSVVVTCSETLDPAGLNLAVSAGPNNVAGALSYDAITSTLTFVPAASLANFTTYTVRVSGMKDLSGNSAFAPSWNFTTGRTADTAPPTVVTVSPASGATRVSAATNVVVTFSEPVDPTTLADGIQVAAGEDSVAGRVTYNAATQTATFTPSGFLASQTQYTVTVAGVDDLAGNLMTAASTSTFTTANTLFADSFESGTANWTLTPPWGVTTDQYVSASHSLTDSPGGNYAPNVNTSATSTVIDVTDVGSVSLSYWLSGQTQAGTDFLRAEYSTNGGPWTTLDAWAGFQNWASHSRTITLPPGTTGLQIRFRFTSNFNQQFDGMYVDDVIVQAL